MFVSSLPSVDKGKQACCRDFSALFVLFALAGVSPPAVQKPKITRKCIAGRCEAVLSEQKCVQARKGTREILFVFSSVLTQYERISARQNLVFSCQSMVSIHTVCLRSSTSKTKKSSRFRSKIFGKQREEYCRIAARATKPMTTLFSRKNYCIPIALSRHGTGSCALVICRKPARS